MMNTLSERVDVLENAAARREEELRELESVSTERQDALLSVIASLEDRIVVLQDQLQIQSERTDTRPEQPVTPWRDCANAVNVVLSQPTTLEDGGLCVAVEAPAPNGSSSHSTCAEVVSPLAQAASPASTTKMPCWLVQGQVQILVGKPLIVTSAENVFQACEGSTT